MALLDLIKRRKSIREFLDTPVEREKVMMCLEAAVAAPSACNSQPWRFIVIDDVHLNHRLCDAAFRGIYSMNSFCKTAPVIVVIVSERSKFLAAIGGMFRGTKYCLIDIGIAGEHFVLQAEDLGLGTCWIGWFNEKAVKSILNIPQQKKVDMLIALGYHNEGNTPSESGREPLDKVTSFNSY